MSNLTKPPILDDTGQDILSALADIKRNLPQGGGSNGYAPTDATEATLADDDKMPFYDTSASGKRNSTWANIKAKLKAYFDTIYATVSDLVSKADNVSVNAKVPSGYGSHGIPKFSQYTGISTDLENLPDVVDDISEALYDSINAHGDLFSSISAQSKGTYYNKTYDSSLHDFDVTTIETDKTAVYMASDINTKLGTAIHDHAAAMIKASYQQSVYDDTTHKMATLTPSQLNATPIDMIDNIQTALEDAVDDHANTIAKLRVELTLAEFNALTPAEQDDPEIVYYITDKPSLGYPIQDDGTATDLIDGALATGRTIESVMRKPYVISSANVVITGTHYGTFSLWSNGMKSFHIQDGSFPTGLIQPTGAVIPDAYVPTGNHYRGCGWTNDYSSTSANIQRVRCFTIGTDKKFYPYTGTGTGFFATAFYN